MKKFIALVLLFVLLFAATIWAATNFVGPTTPDYTAKGNVLKFTCAEPTAEETMTFNLNGIVTRIVVKAAITDSNGVITIKDTSGVAYFTMTGTLVDGYRNYALSGVNQAGTVIPGIAVAGENVITVTNGDHNGAISIWLYVDRILKTVYYE